MNNMWKKDKAKSNIESKCKILAKKEIKRDMTIYACISIGDYVNKMVVEEHCSGISKSQMELLRTKTIRFCGILISSVMSVLNNDDQLLLLLIKTWSCRS